MVINEHGERRTQVKPHGNARQVHGSRTSKLAFVLASLVVPTDGERVRERKPSNRFRRGAGGR
jgi:hypothetical protein